MPSTSLEIQDRDSGQRFRTDEVTPRHQKRPGFRVLLRLSWISLDLPGSPPVLDLHLAPPYVIWIFVTPPNRQRQALSSAETLDVPRSHRLSGDRSGRLLFWALGMHTVGVSCTLSPHGLLLRWRSHTPRFRRRHYRLALAPPQ
jgi:hypothetical protein